jgi:RluA family pseudouridine synthase
MPDILYQDARVVAVSKPAGQPVIPGRGEIGEPLLQETSRSLKARLYAVHRIDRPASGVVVLAKDPETHRLLSGLFESRRVAKKYLALVAGISPQDGTIDTRLRIYGSGRTAADARGKPSLTRYKTIERYQDASLVEALPETGRRHQIRAHLFSIGHPIAGDPLYGDKRTAALAPRLMLHASEIFFKGLLFPPFQAPIPADFQGILERAKAGPLNQSR